MDPLFLLFWLILIWLCRIEAKISQAVKKTECSRHAQSVLWRELMERTKDSGDER